MSRVRARLRGVVLAAALLTSTGCTDWALYDLDYFWAYVPWLSTLRGSVAYKPYELPRLPPEGAIPVATPIGDVPPPFTQQDLVTGNLPDFGDPLPPTPDVLERGEVIWDRQCAICHGPLGEGNGPVVGPTKFPFAPSIVSPAAKNYSDEYLYGIIRVGRGLMPAYGERIRHTDRWALVTYMRQLQGVPLQEVQPADRTPLYEGEDVPDLPPGSADSIAPISPS